jgi:hypothetical protein
MIRVFMIRAISIALAVLALTLVLLPFQLIGIAFGLRLQRSIPHFYHRILCTLIGVRIREVGRRSTASPALILSNHVLPAQPVDATQALNLSAGVSNCKGLTWSFVELTSHFVQIGL